MENEIHRVEIDRREGRNLLARILQCSDGYRVECWIVNADGYGNGQHIRTKGYVTLTGARKYAERFASN